LHRFAGSGNSLHFQRFTKQRSQGDGLHLSDSAA
jgi:hypothetical protein